VSEPWCRGSPIRTAALRSVAPASRVATGGSPKLCSIVAMMLVVSYVVLSTPDLTIPADRTSAGMRVPGPHLSTVGGETWSTVARVR